VHPLRAGARPTAVASAEGVRVAGSRVDALVAAPGGLLRTAAPDQTQYGLGLVLRTRESAQLRLEHCVFASRRDRPIVFSWVRLENRTDDVLVLRYSELWDVELAPYGAAEGVCMARGPGGLCILADLENVIRAHPPERQGDALGLSLDLQFAVPPGARRQLSFAYAVPEDEAEAASLVRAWRGRVRGELEETLGQLRGRFAGQQDAVEAYRVAFGSRSG